MKHKKVIGILIVIVLLIIFPYMKAEWLTAQYGNEFDDLYKESHMLDSISYFKVMKYSEMEAEVYYVQGEHLGADLFTFIKDNNQWKLDSWETVWSKYGSADKFIWPYYR